MSIELWEAIVMGFFGGLVGSFLNVCIVRLPAEQSVITPRSRCPRCGSLIAWYDNIPVFSWLVLRGQCRQCRNPIGLLYPLVELATGLAWAWFGWRYGISLATVEGAVFFTLLIGITMTDAREYIIPDEFTIGGLIFGLLFSVAGGMTAVADALLGALVGFALLWLVGAAGTWAFKEEAMGGGDIKMMAMVGAFVGWQGVLLTVFLGALAGAIIFLPMSLMGRKKLVPFGVFLAVGAALAYLWGGDLIVLYRRFAGF